MRREAVVWAAGLFEGEGTVQHPDQGGFALRLSMTDEDAVRSFHAALGVGTVKDHDPGNPKWKPQWRWSASGKNAYAAAIAMLPWLHERRSTRVKECVREWLAR